MWLFTEHGFYSAVRDGERIVVRARRPGDLEKLSESMPGLSEVEVSPGRDYRYRAFASREDFAAGVAAVALDIDYSNFKSRVDSKPLERRTSRNLYSDVCHRVWNVVEKMQPGGAYGRSRRAGYPSIPAAERKH